MRFITTANQIKMTAGIDDAGHWEGTLEAACGAAAAAGAGQSMLPSKHAPTRPIAFILH